MGIPAPAGVGAAGTPPAGDQANGVISGAILATGPSDPFCFWGPFNFSVWGNAKQTLTTTANSLTASVGSATGLIKGQGISGVNVPLGTTVGNLSGTTVTLALPPSALQANIASGADATALFMGAAWVGSVQLERSFDGGNTWLVAGVGGTGAGAVYSGATQAGVPVSVVGAEPEKGVLYRVNCTAFTSTTAVTINWRLAATGAAATAFGIPLV